MGEWQPIETAPKNGKFLVAQYAPTNWSYWVATVVLHEENGERVRAVRLKYARAWMPLPPPPSRAGETEGGVG